VSEPLRVLVVEDNPADADLVREMLPETELVSFQVESVPRLSTAIDCLKAGAFDLVLLDLGLPDSRGLGTYLKLRDAAPDVAVVVFTGNEDQELGVAAVREGAQDYLIKGQVVGDLLARVAYYAVERERVEEALRESERELKEAQRLGRIGHWQFDVKAQRLRWSDMVFAIYKRDPKRGPPTVEEEAAYYSSQDAKRLRDCARRAIEASEPYEIEVRVNLPEGRIADVVAIGTPVKDAHGRVISLMGTVQDITARKQAEKALQESEKRLSLALEATADGIYDVDFGTGKTYHSPRYAAMLGYGPAELPLSAGSGTWEGLLHPDDRESAVRTLDRCLKGEADGYDMEFRMRTKTGDWRWIQSSARVVGRDLAGNPLRLVGTHRDITERKQAQAALAESELKYRLVVENASEAIFIAQHKFILFANLATFAMIGYSREELLARPFVDFIHPDDRDMVLERYYAWMKGEELPSLYAFRVVRKDGQVRWMELNTVLIDWKGEPATLNLASDITERREASDRLRKSLEGTIQALALTTEMRDPYTAGHQEQVTRLACAIAGKMGLSEERAEGLRVAALLHDVGKISIPAEILSKPTTLTPIEFSLVKAHPQTGYEILKGIDFPGPVAEIVLEHHERLDGCGYPRGLKGEAILLEAKILAVADVVEAMASHRPYRPALGIEKALETTSKEKGTLYDPAVVEACIRLFSEGRFAFEK
jgi:PAS domain S-box-containing protein/putative nucleotidyltransferase with HDIG domain